MLFNPLLIGLQNNQTSPEAGNALKNKVRGLGVMFGDLVNKTTSESTDVASGILNGNIKSVLENPEILSGIQLVIDNPEKIAKSGLLAKLVQSDSTSSPTDVIESLKKNPNIKLTEIPEGTLLNPVKLENFLKANSIENLPGLIIKANFGGEVKTFLLTPEGNTGAKTDISSLLQKIIPVETLAPVEAEVVSAKFISSGEITVSTETVDGVEPISLTIVDAKKLVSELANINSGNVLTANTSDTLPTQVELPIQNSEGKITVTEEMKVSKEKEKASDNILSAPLYKKLSTKDNELSKSADIVLVPDTVETKVVSTVKTPNETSEPEQKIISSSSAGSTSDSNQNINDNSKLGDTKNPQNGDVIADFTNKVDNSSAQKISSEHKTPVQETVGKSVSTATNIDTKGASSAAQEISPDAEVLVNESKEKSTHNTSVDLKNVVTSSKTVEKISTSTENLSAEGSSETDKKIVIKNSEISASSANTNNVVSTTEKDNTKEVAAKTDSAKINIDEKSKNAATDNKVATGNNPAITNSAELKDNSEKSSHTNVVDNSVEKGMPKTSTGSTVNPDKIGESSHIDKKPANTQQVNPDKIKAEPVESKKPNLAQNPDFIKRSDSPATAQTNKIDTVTNETHKTGQLESLSGNADNIIKDEQIKFVASSNKVSELDAANKNPKTVNPETTAATSAKVEFKHEGVNEAKTVEIESLSVNKKVAINLADQPANKNVEKTNPGNSVSSDKQIDNVSITASGENEKINSAKVEVKPEGVNELKTVKIESLSYVKKAGANSADPISTKTDVNANQNKSETTLLNQTTANAENTSGKLANNENLLVKEKPASGSNVAYNKADVSESTKSNLTTSSLKQDIKIDTAASGTPKISTEKADILNSEVTKVTETDKSSSQSSKDSLSELTSEIKKMSAVNSPKIDVVKDTGKIEIENANTAEHRQTKTVGKSNNEVKTELLKPDLSEGKKVVVEGSENSTEIKAAKFAENINNRVRSVKGLLNTIYHEKTETTPQLRVKSGTQQNVRSVIEQLNLGVKPKTEMRGILEQLQVFAKKPEISVTGAQKTANDHFRNRILAGPGNGTSDIKFNLRNINQYSNIDKIFVADKENSYTKFIEGSKAQFWSETNQSITDNGKNLNDSHKTVNVTGNNGENIQKTNKSETLSGQEIKNNAENKVIITSSSLKSNLKLSDGTELVQDIKKMFQGRSESKVEITYKPASETTEPLTAKTGTLLTENKQPSANLNFREREFMNAERVQKVEREIENTKAVEKSDNPQSTRPKIDVEVRELFNLLEKSSDKTLLSQLKSMTGKYLAGKFEIKLIDDKPEAAGNSNISYSFAAKETQNKESVDRVTGYFDPSNSFTENENKSFTSTNSDTGKDNSHKNTAFKGHTEENKIEFKESFRFDGPGLRTDDKSNVKIESRRPEEMPAESEDTSTDQTMSTSENNTAFLSDDKENFENVKDFFNISDNKVVSDTIKTSSIFTSDDPVKHVKAKNLMPEISKFFEQKYNNSITFKITPEHLGKVRVSLKLVNDVLKASIEVENEQVKQLVESNMSSLKSTLMMNGLTTGDINVMVSNQSAKQSKYFPHQKKRDKSFADDRESVETTQMDDSTLINRRNYGYNTYEFTA